MKKLISILLLLALSASLFACAAAKEGSDTTDSDSTVAVTGPDGFEDITAPPVSTDTAPGSDTVTEPAETELSPAQQSVEAAKAFIGTTDPETGALYAFSYDGIFTENETKYHRVRVSLYIAEQERYSLCGYVIISPDGTCSKLGW
ncbi:MAG: hypothetical protein IJD22_02525 [Clostridia bacterium]|nr:hypothetical protein [Clostridia bacterium]